MKQVIKSLLFAFCVIGAPNNVYAYPFQPNPASFQKYMNTVKWSPGNKVKFQDLDGCEEQKPIIGFVPHKVRIDGKYRCTGGFVTWTNPQGTRVCEVTWVSFDDRNRYKFEVESCRWK